MSTPKKKFILRIPLRKLNEAKKKRKNSLATNNSNNNDTDSASNTNSVHVNSVNSAPNENHDNTHNNNNNNNNDDESEDMHDMNNNNFIPPLCKQLEDNDIYTDDDEPFDSSNNINQPRKLKLKSKFLLDNDDTMFFREKEKEEEEDTNDNDDDDDDDDDDDGDIQMKDDNCEIERLKQEKEEKEKEKENNLLIVDREYENLMKESMQVSSRECRSIPSNEIIKLERKKELEMTLLSADENAWIQNEKHALSMRHISIRDDNKKLLHSFIKQSVDNTQFKFIKLNIEAYFSLIKNKKNKKKEINTNLLLNVQLNQLFNIQLNQQITDKIIQTINNLEQFILEKHFEIQKTEKTVKFTMENYQKCCNSIKNKFESCPILYILLLNNQIGFNDLLQSDMTQICLICINAIIRKKIQKKLESLIRKQNANNVEILLFQHWCKNREKQEEKEKEKEEEEEEEEESNKLLHDKYPLFCQRYLQFLMSFPDYRNLIISNHNEMSKIFKLTDQQLLNPPTLEIKLNNKNKKNNLFAKTINFNQNKKRKHFQGNTTTQHGSLSKRRKLSSDQNNNNNNNHNNNNNNKDNENDRIIWDGLVINDSVKCHIKMKQIGGKSIWTLPFKHENKKNNVNSKQAPAHLSISGRINVSSIIKFIKQLRKHKSRRILFAEIESNEYVDHNSYNILSSQLRSSGRAGVIDFEKQCGILIYIISSSLLAPNHSVSHHLNKYFDGHKAKLPKTKMFSIIILSLDVYNQVKRKISKHINLVSPVYNKPPVPIISHSHSHSHPHPPSLPPKPNQNQNQNQNNNGKKAPKPPPQPPKPPNIDKKDQQKEVDDVWDKLGNEIEDDLGELPPPLPAHLLAERERYKQQHSNNNNDNIINIQKQDANINMAPQPMPPIPQPPPPPPQSQSLSLSLSLSQPPLPIPPPPLPTISVPAPVDNTFAVYPHIQPQPMMYQAVPPQMNIPPPFTGLPVQPPPPQQHQHQHQQQHYGYPHYG